VTQHGAGSERLNGSQGNSMASRVICARCATAHMADDVSGEAKAGCGENSVAIDATALVPLGGCITGEPGHRNAVRIDLMLVQD
jgi:hypothetical protein